MVEVVNALLRLVKTPVMLALPALTHTFCHIHFVSQWVRRFLGLVTELECMIA